MENDNIMRIVYMLMIASFIGIFVVRSYFGKFKLAVSHISIWSIIFLITFVVFSYRDNFLSIRDNVMGELFPSDARTGADGEIIIHKSMNGHFYIDLEINNVDIKFMIDTGASRVVLSKRDAFRIGIDDSVLNFKNRVYTANGNIMVAPITISKIFIDGKEFRNISASVNGGDMKISLLGMSFLNKLNSFTIEKNRLIMKP